MASVAPSSNVEIWGPRTRGHWAVGTNFAIHPLSHAGARRRLSQLEAEAHAGSRVLLWVSKGFPWGTALAKAASDRITVLADFDDDDEALASEFTRRSLSNRLRLNPFRQGSPERLRRSQQALRGRADKLTFASHALAATYGVHADYLRVPHARVIEEPQRTSRREVTDKLTIGFMGTMRQHKGLPEIVRALRGDQDLELVTFDQPGLNVPSDLLSRWRQLPPRTPLVQAYKEIDVSVVPMDSSSRGAAVQLPAKAIDSAVNRTAMAATRTRAMAEYFEGSAIWVDDWADLGSQLRDGKVRGDLDRRAAKALELAKENFSIDIVKHSVAKLLTEL